jgi:cytochrome c553
MQLFNPRAHARLLLAALAASIVGIAHASDGSRLYEPCVGCHQPNAWGSPDGAIPTLAGQQKRYLERQLARFQSGANLDSAMPVVAAHPSFGNPHAIVVVASYLAALDANPKPVEGGGDHLRLGQESFTHICAACHGADGRGSAVNRVPRISGQHYPYLRRQIEAAAELHKDYAPLEMTSAIRGMRPQEKDALADYVSRLGNSP